MFIEKSHKTKQQPIKNSVSGDEISVKKKKCDKNIMCTIQLANEMIALARKGYEQREDPGCGIMYGIMLDAGYRLLNLALKEKDSHIKKGWWHDNESSLG